MSTVLSELVALLGLERLELNLFRGQSQNLGWGRVFGGQVLGQALSAAAQTTPESRIVHSLHGYFLRRCTTLEKTMLLAGAACVVFPSAVTDLTGLGLGAAVLLMQRLRPAES